MCKDCRCQISKGMLEESDTPIWSLKSIAVEGGMQMLNPSRLIKPRDAFWKKKKLC